MSPLKCNLGVAIVRATIAAVYPIITVAAIFYRFDYLIDREILLLDVIVGQTQNVENVFHR